MKLKKPFPKLRKAVWIRIIKIRYGIVLRRLREMYPDRKVRVGFMVSEIAKWKGQSVYDYMAQSSDFEPIMLVYPSRRELKCENNRMDDLLAEKQDYFQKNGMNVKIIWSSRKNKALPLKDVDILFYQQQWDIPPAPGIEKTSRHSLSFYFPYYVLNNFHISGDLSLKLHHQVFRYILLDDDQVKFFQSFIKARNYAGEMVGLGHPALDVFYLKKDYVATKNYVIYAPHFSFKCDNSINRDLIFSSSTFLELGRPILEFAQQHPEINWVFKPHPRLRTELTDYNAWTKEDVDDYYHEWERIGTACYDSHYQELFLVSKAMITDSCSFLTEYGCTGKPLIRLIPDMGKDMPRPNPALEKLYDSYYKVFGEEELYKTLQMVVLEDKDPMKPERIENLKSTHLAGNYAAKNITEYIRSLLTQ